MNIYKELCTGGGFSLPFLLNVYSTDKSIDLYLINDKQDFVYNGKTYKASTFNYNPSTQTDTVLSIELVQDDRFIDLLESQSELNVDAIGIFYNGAVSEIQSFSNKFGEATWDGKKLDLQLYKDDRGDMTFPAMIFNSYNNRGNN